MGMSRNRVTGFDCGSGGENVKAHTGALARQPMLGCAAGGRLFPGVRLLLGLAVMLALLFVLLAVDPVTSDAAPGSTCPNKYFRTGPGAKLPDCRAYELVTPRYAAGIAPEWSSGFSCCPPNAFPSQTLSNDGNSVAFMTLAALPGLPGNGYLDEYRSFRTDHGWVTVLNGPTAAQAEKSQPGGVISGGEYAFEETLGTVSADLWPPFAGLQSTNLFRSPKGVEPIAMGSLGESPKAEGLYISPDGKHVIFMECPAFFGECPKLEPQAKENQKTLYDREPGGETHVVSLLPGDVTPNGAMEFFGATSDGTEVAFAETYAIYGYAPLYVRRNNTTTVEAIRPRGVVPGKTLECIGEPSGGATIEYQWLRNGAPIPGAVNPNYLITEADASTLVQCEVIRSNAEGKTFGVTSSRVVAPYASKDFPETEGFAYISPTGTPSIAVGESLTCNTAQFSTLQGAPTATVTYEWLRSGTPIAGETTNTYTTTESDLGKAIQCRATGATAEGQAIEYSYNSLVVTPVTTKATANPTISDVTSPGTAPAVGDELSCSNGTWTDTPTSFAYQWLRNGAPIGGAASSTYTVVVADEGKGLQCAVTATNSAASTKAVSNRIVAAGGPPGTPVHHFLETFGSAEQPTFGWPEAMAVDQSTGDLYVIDANTQSVLRYHADGTPDDFSALGTNVLENVTGECTENKVLQIAVDNSGGSTDGNVYVNQWCSSSSAVGSRVHVFSSTGEHLGDLTKAGSTNLESICGVAVDAAGALYVGDYYGIHKYVTAGSAPVNEDDVKDYSTGSTGIEGCDHLAAGTGSTAGYLFVANYPGELFKLDTATGEVKYTVTSGVTMPYVDPSTGYVYALKETGFQVYDASGAGSATLISKAQFTEGHGIAVRASTHNVYVSRSPYANEHVEVYGAAVPTGPEPPELVSAGGIYGTAEIGSSLYCEPGFWNGEPTFSRQWLRNGAPIPGATESSYTIVAEDAESVVECEVKATNGDGSTIGINANEGAKYVRAPGGPPPASYGSARWPNSENPSPQYNWGGIFNGYVFYNDRPTNLYTVPYADKPGDLYSVDTRTGEIIMVSHDTNDNQFVNISEDGSHVFFASRSKYNGEGETGKPNLYVWSRSDESIKYIATVGERDVESYGGNGEAGLTNWAHSLTRNAFDQGRPMDHSRSTPDGEAFAFESSAPPPGFDNTEATPSACGVVYKGKQPCNEVYLYDVRTNELHCVSCGPGSGPATGEARLQSIRRNFGKVEPTNGITFVNGLTDNGEELFFETTEGLVPRDQNETKDVYRWKKGEGVALISTGQSLSESAIFGVNPSGNDVIFATRQPLLPEDENGSTVRFYDARVDGGFPPPESSVTEPCSNDVCQGQASAPPEEPQLSSSSINGAGDFTGKLRCGKGQRRITRHGKETCVPRRHRRRHHRHNRKHHHHNASGRGAGR
jgi:hypothetical protein